MSKARIVPAILTADPAELEKMVRQAETFTEFVQIDIMDGKFVPSQSINWEDVASIKPRIGWEAHLMVEQPEEYLPGFRKAGAGKVIFHYEATDSPQAAIAGIKKLGMEAGLAVNPETPVASILPLLDGLDSMLFMSVIPGFYGSKFIPEVLDKVSELRSRSDILTGIDGGINQSNINRVAGSGVDYICVGSAVFLQPQPAASFRRLESLIRG